MENLGYSKGIADSNLYFEEIHNGLMILVIFIYDIFFGGNDDEIDKFAK